jgi:hypothetical protein
MAVRLRCSAKQCHFSAHFLSLMRMSWLHGWGAGPAEDSLFLYRRSDALEKRRKLGGVGLILRTQVISVGCADS